MQRRLPAWADPSVENPHLIILQEHRVVIRGRSPGIEGLRPLIRRAAAGLAITHKATPWSALIIGPPNAQTRLPIMLLTHVVKADQPLTVGRRQHNQLDFREERMIA